MSIRLRFRSRNSLPLRPCSYHVHISLQEGGLVSVRPNERRPESRILFRHLRNTVEWDNAAPYNKKLLSSFLVRDLTCVHRMHGVNHCSVISRRNWKDFSESLLTCAQGSPGRGILKTRNLVLVCFAAFSELCEPVTNRSFQGLAPYLMPDTSAP